MKEEQTSEEQGDLLENEFIRIKAEYKKAVSHQHHDPIAALATARRIAEEICRQLVRCETSHEPSRWNLHKLIGQLTAENALPAYIIAPLRTIQSYGNVGSHALGKNAIQITSEYVQPCLYGLFTVINWYLGTYWPDGDTDIPFPVSDIDVKQAEAFRKTKKTAILVIMFIDMVSSTKTRENLGEIEFEKLRQDKKDLLRVIIERENKGKLIKDLGDGYLAVFSIPGTAVETALEIQEKLASEPEYQVRIGLDMGQVIQESECGIVSDVIGEHVNRAARIEALCEGTHILTSYPVWDSAKGWLKHFKQIAWKKHGSYWLKGIADPQEIYEPYNIRFIDTLAELHGKKAEHQEELTHCKLCGRYVQLLETFTCRTCGTEGICTEHCFDTVQRQCIECSTKKSVSSLLETKLEAEKLMALENPDSSFTVKIWTEHEQRRGTTRNILVAPKKEYGKYRIGDRVVAYFESSTDVYVYMINIGPTGDITPIFPNDYSSDNHVRAGKRYTFPNEDAPFEWILQEPTGTETIKVIATKVPVDIAQILDAQRSLSEIAKALSSDQWAEASCTLLVQKR